MAVNHCLDIQVKQYGKRSKNNILNLRCHIHINVKRVYWVNSNSTPISNSHPLELSHLDICETKRTSIRWNHIIFDNHWWTYEILWMYSIKNQKFRRNIRTAWTMLPVDDDSISLLTKNLKYHVSFERCWVTLSL